MKRFRTLFPGRWVLPLLLVLAVGFLLGLRPLADNNIEFHLHGGRWILEQHSFPEKDPFTYAAADRDYVDVHWLFQIAAYGLFRLGGYEGLSVVNALLSLALLGLIALRLRRLGAGPASAAWVLLAAAVIMHQRYLMRPENVSFLYLALLALLLDRYLAAGVDPLSAPPAGSAVATAVRQLWPIAFIHLLWANTQGLFILGWVVVGAYWVSASVRARRPDRPLAATLAASVLVCLANPYGVTGLLFPFRLLSRFDRANVFAQHVGEFQPLLKVGGLFEDYVLLGFAVALLVAGALAWRRLRPHEVLLPVFFGWLALAGIRNVPLFVIVSAPVLGRALTAASRLDETRSRAGRSRLRTERFAALLLSVVALGLALRIGTGAFFRTAGLPQGGIGVGLDRTMRPVEAGEFLLTNRLDGRILNSSNIGGWLGWVLPQAVFMDMRLEVMGESLFQAEVDSWKEGGLEPLIGRYDPQLIVFDHGGGARGWIGQLASRKEWRLVHVDGTAAVFAHREYATWLPGLAAASLPGRFGLGPLDEVSVRRILEHPVAGRSRRWLEGFFSRSKEAGPFEALGRFSEELGETAAAERFYLERLAWDPGGAYDVYQDLAAIYGSEGRPSQALSCYEQYLQYEPKSPVGHNGRGIARVMLGDQAGAIRDFTRAIELDPEFELALLNRGLARLGLADASGAVADYTRALRINPASEQAREGLDAARRQLR